MKVLLRRENEKKFTRSLTPSRSTYDTPLVNIIILYYVRI